MSVGFFLRYKFGPYLHRFLSFCRDRTKRAQEVQCSLGAYPGLVQIYSDYDKWTSLQHYPNIEGPIHALGLHRDRSRGWTHVIVQEMEYTSLGTRRGQDLFRVVRCGIFRGKEIAKDIDTITQSTNLYQAALTAATTLSDGPGVPVLILSFGQITGMRPSEFLPWLGLISRN